MTSVANRVDLLICIYVWFIKWMALLCLTILKSLMHWFMHVDRKRGHVCIMALAYVCCGFGSVIGHNMCLLWFPYIMHI